MLDPETLLNDRYLILSPIGQGGMGAVYQATDQKFGNEVAIKETFYSDQQLRGAFSREAKLLNRLRHAALPVVMDYFDINDRQFLVMQYIPGRDLERCLNERMEEGVGPFPVPQVLSWADQLLDALEYLHSQSPPIIHRDIKPQNMKLTPRGEIVLLDFGLAKGDVSRHSVSSRGIRGYTPNYASLEQIRGMSTDARSDVYSMGATLWHLLTGELPQDVLTRIAAMLLGQPDPLPAITDLNPDVPLSVAAVIDKAVSPNPDQRFANAAMMRQALRNSTLSNGQVSFHRTPTLVDDPLFSTIEVAASVRLNPRIFESGGDRQEEREESRGASTPVEVAQEGQSGITGESEVANSRSSFGSAMRIHPAGYVVAALLILAAIAGLGIFRLQRWGNGLIASINGLVATTQANVGGPALAIPMRVEAMRYHLEIAPLSGGPSRTTGLMPLADGSRFKFHFRPHAKGYLYIIAPGAGDIWQTFLTNEPMPSSGVTTNAVAGGREYMFPDGGQWFMMQPEAEITPFTIIYSTRPLAAPAFLSMPSGRNLSHEEMRQLDQFKKMHAVKPAELVAVADNNQPSVAVQVPAERSSDDVLVFDISLRKR